MDATQITKKRLKEFELAAKSPCEIHADVMYDFADLERRGVGISCIRMARRKGLLVRKIGRKHFILGKDLIRFAEECAEVVK